MVEETAELDDAGGVVGFQCRLDEDDDFFVEAELAVAEVFGGEFFAEFVTLDVEEGEIAFQAVGGIGLDAIHVSIERGSIPFLCRLLLSEWQFHLQFLHDWAREPRVPLSALASMLDSQRPPQDRKCKH